MTRKLLPLALVVAAIAAPAGAGAAAPVAPHPRCTIVGTPEST